MKYLIGSRALKLYNNDYVVREGADWDIIGEKDDVVNMTRAEFSPMSDLNNMEIVSCFADYENTLWIEGLGEVTPISMRGLAVLKRSHLWRDRFFVKHMSDYNRYLKSFLVEGDFVDGSPLRNRFKLSLKKFKNMPPNLNKTNEDFFDDLVVKKYNHDDIHEIAAYVKKQPMYLKMKRDFSLAKCEKDMWENLTYEQKIMCVAEETYVIACERFLIPHNWPRKYLRSFTDSLEKVCTTLTSGWFRDFAIDNYSEISKMYDPLKFDNIKDEIDERFEN